VPLGQVEQGIVVARLARRSALAQARGEGIGAVAPPTGSIRSRRSDRGRCRARATGRLFRARAPPARPARSPQRRSSCPGSWIETAPRPLASVSEFSCAMATPSNRSDRRTRWARDALKPLLRRAPPPRGAAEANREGFPPLSARRERELPTGRSCHRRFVRLHFFPHRSGETQSGSRPISNQNA
jgi:hypothetical protein